MGSSAQKNGFHLASTPLVSTPPDAPQPSTIAATQQEEAIRILKDEDDKEIFAWITLARSLGPHVQHCSDDACLTREQIRAIGALRHLKSNDINALLHLARTSSPLETPAASAQPHVYSLAPDQGYTAPSVLSDATIHGPLDQFFHPAPSQEAAVQDSLTRAFPTAAVSPSQAKPKYCCTLCSYVRPFKNQSDWKKHEKEHDTTYVCMRMGPRESTTHGSQCAFCGIPNPHDVHLIEHNAQACLQGPPDSFTSKRRHELVNHLKKIHGIHPKSQGEAIAARWKHTVEKQAWSCGFCVTTFTTFNERLCHIATQHFERGQTIDQWDVTKVIQGLLQQSGMIQAWEEKLGSRSTRGAKDITWERDAITGLQHDLEVGPNGEKSAEDSAEAAYAACRLNWGMEHQRIVAAAEATPDDTLISTPFTPNQSQTSLASAPTSDSDDHVSLSAVQEFNKGSHGGLATQTIHHGYINVSSSNLNHSNHMRLAPSSFYPQQTHSVSTHQDNNNERRGHLGDDKEESERWLMTPKLPYETASDAVFDLDDLGA